MLAYLERLKEGIIVFSPSETRSKSNTVNSQDLLNVNANTFIVITLSQKAHILLKTSQCVSPGVR